MTKFLNNAEKNVPAKPGAGDPAVEKLRRMLDSTGVLKLTHKTIKTVDLTKLPDLGTQLTSVHFIGNGERQEGLLPLIAKVNVSDVLVKWAGIVSTDLVALEPHRNSLIWLTLDGNDLDDNLSSLADFHHLQFFSLCNNHNHRITSAALKHLEGLVNLIELDLCQTRVKSLESICLLVKLEELYLAHTKVSSRDLRAISEHRRLKTLVLNGTDVGNLAVRSLPVSTQEVSFIGCQRIDDGALKYFEELPKLRFLNLADTSVTNRRAMTSALPECQITWVRRKRIR